MRYMLDTNICVYVSKHKPLQVLDRFSRLEPGEAGMSLVTYGELRFGASKSSQFETSLRKLENFVRDVPVLPLEKNACTHYASIRAQLQRLGTPIGSNDLWIAAHCLSLDLTLVTNNVNEFIRVPDLHLENWTD